MLCYTSCLTIQEVSACFCCYRIQKTPYHQPKVSIVAPTIQYLIKLYSFIHLFIHDLNHLNKYSV